MVLLLHKYRKVLAGRALSYGDGHGNWECLYNGTVQQCPMDWIGAHNLRVTDFIGLGMFDTCIADAGFGGLSLLSLFPSNGCLNWTGRMFDVTSPTYHMHWSPGKREWLCLCTLFTHAEVASSTIV